MAVELPDDWWVEHSGQRLVLDPKKVADEIEHLRSLSGAVSPGPSMADIKRERNATGG